MKNPGVIILNDRATDSLINVLSVFGALARGKPGRSLTVSCRVVWGYVRMNSAQILNSPAPGRGGRELPDLLQKAVHYPVRSLHAM